MLLKQHASKKTNSTNAASAITLHMVLNNLSAFPSQNPCQGRVVSRYGDEGGNVVLVECGNVVLFVCVYMCEVIASLMSHTLLIPCRSLLQLVMFSQFPLLVVDSNYLYS